MSDHGLRPPSSPAPSTDQEKMEEEHIIDALTKCGYPKWSFKKVKKQIAEKMERKKEKRKIKTK